MKKLTIPAKLEFGEHDVPSLVIENPYQHDDGTFKYTTEEKLEASFFSLIQTHGVRVVLSEDEMHNTKISLVPNLKK